MSNLQLADFAEMMAVDRNSNSQREHFRPVKKSPEQDLPILESLSAENTQADTESESSQYRDSFVPWLMPKENDRMLQTLAIDSKIVGCESAGARKVFLIEEAMAAALSACTT